VQAIIHIFKKFHTFKKDEGSSHSSESQNWTNFLRDLSVHILMIHFNITLQPRPSAPHGLFSLSFMVFYSSIHAIYIWQI